MGMKIGRNERGMSLIALVVTISLLGVIGFIMSSLMVRQQETTPRFLDSTRALYTAQAGIEWATRYAKSDCTTFATNPSSLFPQTRSLSTPAGTWSFTVSYSSGSGGTITSASTVGYGSRSVSSTVNPCEIILNPSSPPYKGTGGSGEQKKVYFPLINNYTSNLYVYRIDLAKSSSGRLNEFYLGSTHVWTGSSVNISTAPGSPTPFPFSLVSYYTLPSGSTTGSYLEVQATPETGGTWYMTIYYSKQTDLSDPTSLTLSFVIP